MKGIAIYPALVMPALVTRDLVHWSLILLRMFFVFLVPPWGLPLYPFTPNDPKNEKYIAIPFICHPGDRSVLENGWVIHIWSGGKIFIFEDAQTNGRMDEPDNYNDQRHRPNGVNLVQ